MFGWASKPGGFGANWPEGLAYLVLGLVGALITLYVYAGDLLPSMGGGVRLALMQQDIDDFRRRRNQALDAITECAKAPGTCDAATVAGWTMLGNQSSTEIARVEAAQSAERRRLIAVAVPSYLVLGGFFAAALATTALQALFIGFGWTAIADRAGLKRGQDEAKKQRDQEVDTIVTRVAAQDAELQQLRAAGAKTLQEKQALLGTLDKLKRRLRARRRRV
ncbi:MAG: hypothetical protein AABM40_04275 [Chloroflexota bacterium]